MARSTKDAIAGGRLKRFMDRRLISALSHPLREHILAVVNERTASASEIGREIDLEVQAFYHHVEVLERLGFIEQVEARQRRGATEHFFQAKPALHFNDRAWEIIPGSVRSDMTVSQIQSIFGDVAGAMRTGVFGASSPTHVTWLPSVFDRPGWQEAMTLMNETLARIMAIQRRSRDRIAVSGDAGILGTIVLLGFESR